MSRNTAQKHTNTSKPTRRAGHVSSERQNLINEVSQLEYQHGRLMREHTLYASKLTKAEHELQQVQQKLRNHYNKLTEGLLKR